MKKVALLIQALGKGGAERVVSRLTEILSDKCELSLILFDASIKEYEVKCPIIDMKIPAAKGFLGRISLAFRRAVKLKRIKKEYGFDCVISFLDSPNIVNILSKIKGCRTVVSIRNCSDIEHSTTLMGKTTDFCIKALYNRADIIVPVTRLIAEKYKKIYGLDENKIKVAYNPYNIESISEQAAEELIESDADFFSGGNVICAMGRFTYQKGYWHLIKAVFLAKKEIPDLKLCIIGDGAQKEKIQSLTKELKIEESVLLTGNQENPFKYISKAKVFVLSSMFEGFPNALAEAMACKTPVIATDCKSGPREILYKEPDLSKNCTAIENADFGILTPAFEKEEAWDTSITANEKIMADAIVFLLNDDEKRKELAALATQRIKDFSYDACGDVYMKIIGD